MMRTNKINLQTDQHLPDQAEGELIERTPIEIKAGACLSAYFSPKPGVRYIGTCIGCLYLGILTQLIGLFTIKAKYDVATGEIKATSPARSKQSNMYSILDVENIRTQLEEKRAVVLSGIHVKLNKPPGIAEKFNPDCSKLAQGYFIREHQSIFIERFEFTTEQVETALTRLGDGYYRQHAPNGQEIHAAF